MDYGRLFTQSWHLIWRHKFLWWFGLIAAMGSVVGAAFRISFLPQLTQFRNGPTGAVFDSLAAAGWEQFSTWLLSGTAVLFIISTAYWLAAAIAQGAIIGAVIDLDAERPSTFRLAARQGWGYLGRFIAIDALVFFPLFLLLLLLMLLVMGGILAIAYLSFQGGGVKEVTAVLAIGLICLLPLTCLLFPIGLLTSAFRTLAFRDTAVCQTGARESIRHTGQIIRRQWGNVLILLALLWGIQYLPGLLLSLLTMGLGAVTAVSPALTGWLGWLVAGVTAVPLAILHAYSAAAWTLAYQELAA